MKKKGIIITQRTVKEIWLNMKKKELSNIDVHILLDVHIAVDVQIPIKKFASLKKLKLDVLKHIENEAKQLLMLLKGRTTKRKVQRKKTIVYIIKPQTKKLFHF